jgi:arylsulfatase
VAQLLKDGGYQTFMAGKWHLGSGEDEIPFAKGFEKSFALMNGAANHFNNQRIFSNEPPQYRRDSNVVLFPTGSFSTDVYTDKMMGYMEQRQHNKPFFAYLAYTAPHWPLQVPKNYMDHYKGRYNMGYDSLRAIRFVSQKAAGIIPENSVLRERNTAIRPWAELSADEKKSEARKMEIYAAMVENLDDHIGQLVQYLKKTGLFDNTVIVFMSDNGAAGEDFYNLPKGAGPFLRAHFDNSYENIGTASSFVSYGPQWAQAGAAPFKLYKSYATEGGIVTPMIISGKFIRREPGIDSSFLTVMDLAPGFLELAHLSYPDIYHNKKMLPQLGNSFVPYLKKQEDRIHNDRYALGLEHDGQCLLIKGKWKITNISEPFDEKAFALYDLSEDMAESNDLSTSNPVKYSEMLREWELFKKKVGVISKERGED